MQNVQRVIQDIAAKDVGGQAELVKFVLESLPCAAFIIHPPERTVAWCNSAVEEVLGYKPEAVIGETTRQLHIDDREFLKFSRKGEPFLARAETFRGRHWMQHADGSHVPTEHVITPIRMIDDRLSVVSFVQRLFHMKDPGLNQGLTELTPREREVFDLTCRGYSVKRIARALDISLRTAEVHRAAVLDKLGYDSAFELLAALLESKSPAGTRPPREDAR